MLVDLSHRQVVYVELHDAILSQVLLDDASLRIELPRFQIQFRDQGAEAETWWVAGRLVIDRWNALRVDFHESWAAYWVVDGELMLPSGGPLSAFRFSGLRIELGTGTIEVDGGEGRLEGIHPFEIEPKWT